MNSIALTPTGNTEDGHLVCSRWLGSDECPARTKSRRTRIKEHRAKRNRKRFYVVIDGVERARDIGVRPAFVLLHLPNGAYQPRPTELP